MGQKKNCWEFMECGREAGGARSSELGVCPASVATMADGFLEGHNGGRACVYITGTMCGGWSDPAQPEMKESCHSCPFQTMLDEEHGTESSALAFYRFIWEKQANGGV